MVTEDRFERQSFLGATAQTSIERARVGIVGLGGGGSHIVQQLAHLGFRRFEVFDPDIAEDSNLNRLVGATVADVAAERLKVEIAERLIRGLRAHAEVGAHAERWQDNPAPLRSCDLVFGCLDSFAGRRELEICARRYLVPLIDIGMDVHLVEPEPPRVVGQVILSMPGGPCMQCLGFLSEETLAREAAEYGDAGPRPQVVWPNGILASTAVGVAVDLLTDWSRSLREVVYLSYDGNARTLEPHTRLRFLKYEPCPHFPLDEVGDPRLSETATR